jgi:hypothetical protein
MKKTILFLATCMTTIISFAQITTSTISGVVVNEKKEACTLFPVNYFSLFPTLTDQVKLSFFIEDLVINANENYLRTKQIAIILDDEKNSLRMKGLLAEILEKKDTLFLKEITIFHFTGLEK